MEMDGESLLGLGTRVHWRHPLKRITFRPASAIRGVRKEWAIKPHQSEWREGVVVGVRHVQNGIRRYIGEDGYTWEPDDYLKVYLIAFDLHRKPVHVRLEDVRPLLSVSIAEVNGIEGDEEEGWDDGVR